MKKAGLIELNRTKAERVETLVSEYSIQQKEDLKLATIRISKRLGPQRTSWALEAIEKEDWEEACLAMLDYYDKCYIYDLNKSEKVETIDISGLNYQLAAEKLIKNGHVY